MINSENNCDEIPRLFKGRKSAETPRKRRQAHKPFSGTVITFFIMFGIWVLLSGKFDVFHISLGVLSCMLVAFFSSDLLFPFVRKGLPAFWLRFIRYIPWLLWQVFIANIHVMYLVFHPRMNELIDPQIIHFKSRLRSDMALVTFANSITLTPGTITIYTSIYGDFTVHAINKAAAQPLPGEMEQRVIDIFGE